MIKFISIIFLSIFIIWSLSFNTYKNDVNLKAENTKKVSVNIPLWTPVKEVWKILTEKWIINHKWTFFTYLKFNELEWKIQAWDYIFNTPISLVDLWNQLQNSRQEEVRIMIPEWSTIEDIDNTLSNKQLIDEWEFIQCAKECTFPEHNFFFDWNIEWYLFPDTYFVPTSNFTPKKFASRMLNNFQIRLLTDEFTAGYKKLWKTLSDVVIMASIVEREERNKKNMPTVAWILWKRLEEKIPLWADATTRYYKKSKNWVLLKSDFQKNNPYNTRMYKWLPPTAISNPWLSAFKAALYPQESPYYYYLHDSDWVIHYSKTNDEHNFMKFKYIK